MISRSKLLPVTWVILTALACFAASHQFQPDAYLKHVRYLAGDALKGRGNGTPELDQASDYIAAQFKAAGLRGAGDQGTFFQKFMLTTGSRLGPGNQLVFKIGQQTVKASLHKDFIPFGVGDKPSLSGEIIFAGYGITAEEYHYDDYKDLDITGKIVLVLSHEPGENDAASPFEGKQTTLHGQDNTKAVNAKYRNALAILIVEDPVNHKGVGKELPDQGPEAQVDELGIPALRITRALAQRLLDAQQKNLLDLQKQIDEKMTPQSFVLTAQADLTMEVQRIRKEVRNVVALLPGTDPSVSDDTVILGAHYDHLGFGGRSSMAPQVIGQIHNGADDNASGTAGLIELASALATDGPHRRAYLFIAFAGEELGLNGSVYWTAHPTRPLEKAVAMINMDMIGRSRENQIVLGGIGTSPLFPELAKSAGAEAGLEVKTSQSGYGASDHTSFYIKNIPVLFFFTGLHLDYHRPTDDWQKINAPGAVKVLNMVYSIATRLNVADTRPQFTKADEPHGGANPASGGGSGYGSYFGSIPDMTGEVVGVRFDDVRPNSPAAKAGLKAQDVMIKFAGKEIKNLEDFTFMLRTHKPGETVDVTVLRNGQPVTVQVTLEVRRN